MPIFTSRALSAGIVGLVALSCAISSAHAGDFQVHPTRVDLAKRGVSSELTLSNRGAEASSFEVKVVRWKQDEQGVMILEPTTDVVVYPSVFSLAGGKQRTIRVATTAVARTSELSYRIVIEELPVRRAAASAGTTIAVRTQIAVPIFIAPAVARVAGEVAATATPGALDVSVENRGTVHVKLAKIHVVGTDAAGAVTLDRTEAGWYLLPSGTRRYRLALSNEECARTVKLSVRAETNRATWTRSVAVQPTSCVTAP